MTWYCRGHSDTNIRHKAMDRMRWDVFNCVADYLNPVRQWEDELHRWTYCARKGEVWGWGQPWVLRCEVGEGMMAAAAGAGHSHSPENCILVFCVAT